MDSQARIVLPHRAWLRRHKCRQLIKKHNLSFLFPSSRSKLPLGITPGEYHIYAFPAGAEIDHRDPDALKPFEKYGEAMKVAEGERKIVNLKAAPIE